MTIGFKWNPLFGTIEEQAKKQGFMFDEVEARYLNNCQMTLFNMKLDGILTEKMYLKILEKLQKFAVSKLRPIKKEEEE